MFFRDIIQPLYILIVHVKEIRKKIADMEGQIKDLREDIQNEEKRNPPGYYSSRLWFHVTARNGEQANLKINNYNLPLHLNNRHEREYFLNAVFHRETIDLAIAQTFVKPHSIVVDAGANIGYLSLVYAALGAEKVFAFEPCVELYERLSALKCPALEVYKYALSEKSAPALLYKSAAHNQGHTLSEQIVEMFPSVFEKEPDCESVEAIAYDDLMSGIPVDFMKVDIEGSEESFINGARKCLDNGLITTMQIEVYPKMWQQVDKILSQYFPNSYVVIQSERQYQYDVVTIEKSITDNINPANPPTYIYTKDNWPSAAVSSPVSFNVIG
jgi:FkbM family methyltransferase